MLVEYVRDNYYVRFHNTSHHRCRALTITMQDFIILAIIGVEKHTLVFNSTCNSDKVNGA